MYNAHNRFSDCVSKTLTERRLKPRKRCLSPVTLNLLFGVTGFSFSRKFFMNSFFRTGILTMSSREIAELTEKRHDNVKRTIESCAESGAISLPQIEEVKVQRERREETVSVYQLDERSSLIVAAQLSPEFTARIVDRWQALENKVAKPAPTLQYSPKDVVEFAEALAKALNVEGSGKLNMLRVSLETTGHSSLTPILPSSAVAAPTGSATSLTILLKKHGLSTSTVKANQMLAAAGFLEEKTRPSSKTPGALRKFWSVTQAGLAFGKNVTRLRHRQLETQPHWYESTFQSLCTKAGLN